MSGPLRASLSLAGFLALTLPLMPLQWLLLKTTRTAQRRLPNWYHRQVCRLLGIRLHIDGTISDDQAVLVVSNHVTWLDIPVLSAVAPVSFVAKKEVASWPFAGALARLQRTVFVDRGSRSSVGKTSNEMATRLQAGDHVVLFAEGTSSDGNKVLPFKTSLFAAAKPPKPRRGRKTGNGAGADTNANTGIGKNDDTGAPVDDGTETLAANAASRDPIIYVQTVALAYVARHGMPLGRLGRRDVAWIGDMEMTSHAWALLKSGPLDVHVSIGAPVPLHDFADRKKLAQFTEHQIRDALIRKLRGRSDDEQFEAAIAPESWTKAQLAPSNAGNNVTWV